MSYRSRRNTINIFQELPVGWWYQDECNKSWTGPFDSRAAAIKMSKSLAPERSMTITVIEVKVVRQEIISMASDRKW